MAGQKVSMLGPGVKSMLAAGAGGVKGPVEKAPLKDKMRKPRNAGPSKFTKQSPRMY